MYPIQPVAKEYAWGSRTRLQNMFAVCGTAASTSPFSAHPVNMPKPGKPLAEMWFSGHSGSPSLVAPTAESQLAQNVPYVPTPVSSSPSASKQPLLDASGTSGSLGVAEQAAQPPTLTSLIAGNPEAMLGPRCSAKFGPVLPYLLKVISARIPLSLQVHPVDFEARRGYNTQNAAGMPLNSPERSFSDPVAKSEMVVALEPFEASIGFLPIAAMLSNLTLVNHPVAQRMVRELTLSSSDAAVSVGGMMPPAAQFWPSSRRKVFCAFYVAASANSSDGRGLSEALQLAATQVGEPRAARAFKYALRASQTFDDDPSSLALLMMNPVALGEGEAVFIPAGTPHAYIHGTAAEIMTNSDNVLRAGLTVKHKDIVDFLRTLDCKPAPPIDPSVNLPEAFTGDRVIYRPRIGEFMLTYGQVGAQGSQWPLIARLNKRYGRLVAGVRHLQRHYGPRIVVCTQGAVQCVTATEHLVLRQGQAVFVPSCDGWLEVQNLDADSGSVAAESGQNEMSGSGSYICASTQV